MINDAYLLLTPILMLLVVGLVGFVGCEFKEGKLPEALPPDAPTGFQASAGNRRVDLRWNDYPGASGYEIKWRGADGTSGSFPVAGGETTFPHTGLTNGVEVFYTLTATVSGVVSYATEEISAIPLISFVRETVDGSIRNNFDGWVGMGIRVGAADLSVVRLGRWLAAGNNATHTVKIVDAASGVDLPSGSVPVDMSAINPADPDFDGFGYETLQPPATLTRNTEYYIVSREFDNGDVFLNADTTITVTNATDATLRSSVYGDVSGAYAPPALSSTNVYGPVNFLYKRMPPP